MKKKMMIIVGSPKNMGISNYIRKCYVCGCNVYLKENPRSNLLLKYQKKYICGNCYLRNFNPEKGKFMISDEQAKFFGIPKKELSEITKILLSTKKEEMKEESTAG